MLRLALSLLLFLLFPWLCGTAWAVDPIALTYEPRPDLPAAEQIGRRFAESLAAGLPGVVQPVPMLPARSSALLDGGATACAVMHGRSPAREPLRQWVAALSHSRTFLVANSPAMGPPGPDDHILALAGGPYEDLARELGARVDAVRNRSQLFQMFQAGRARYWVEDRRVLEDAVRDGVIPGFHIVRELTGQTGWLACSNAVPADVIAALAARLAQLRADGTVGMILHDAGHGDGSPDGRSSSRGDEPARMRGAS